MRFWFKKKEFNIDDVVPVTVAKLVKKLKDAGL